MEETGPETTQAAGAGWRPDLLETMRFDPMDGIVALEAHLARLKASAQALGLTFDRHAIRNDLHAATFRLIGTALVRLRVSPDGDSAIESGPLPSVPFEPVAVGVEPLPVVPDDPRLRHFTGDRTFYDTALQRAGRWEVLFTQPDGQLTGGSFTNLFVPRGDTLLTPPLDAGLLPGVLRAQLLEDGQAREARLEVADLRDGFFVGNVIYGLVAAVLA